MLLLLIKLNFVYAKFRKIKQKNTVLFIKAKNMININIIKSLI